MTEFSSEVSSRNPETRAIAIELVTRGFRWRVSWAYNSSSFNVRRDVYPASDAEYFTGSEDSSFTLPFSGSFLGGLEKIAREAHHFDKLTSTLGIIRTLPRYESNPLQSRENRR